MGPASMSIRIIFISTLLLTLVQSNALAQATITDPIKIGYERMYQGDTDGAIEYFRGITEHEPQNLAASFGILMAMYEKGLQGAERQKEFETRTDQLIQAAEARYSKNKQDSEALFYLSQAYLHRGRYRVDFNKGMWGAARDGVAAKGYGDTYIKQNPNRAD